MKSSDDLNETELLGGWKSLVSAVMFHAVRRYLMPLSPGKRNMSEPVLQQEVATYWFSGGVGVITFEEACETLGYDPEAFHERLSRLKRQGNFNVPDLARR